MGQTSTGASVERVRALGIVVGACLLVVAAALALLPVTVETAGGTAGCGTPLFALRAPSEASDPGFNEVEDACSGAAVGRLFLASLLGGAGVAIVVGSQRLARRRDSGIADPS